MFATSMLLGIMKYFNCVKEHGHSLGVNQGIKKKIVCFPELISHTMLFIFLKISKEAGLMLFSQFHCQILTYK